MSPEYNNPSCYYKYLLITLWTLDMQDNRGTYTIKLFTPPPVLILYQLQPSLIFVVQVVAYTSDVILTMSKKARVFVFEKFFQMYIMFKC